jgi:hypothetical protein
VILLILGLEFFLVYIVLTGVTSAPVLSCALSLEPAFCDPRPSTPSGLQLGACRFCLQGALGRAGQAEKLPWQCSSPPNPQSSLWLPSSLDHLAMAMLFTPQPPVQLVVTQLPGSPPSLQRCYILAPPEVWVPAKGPSVEHLSSDSTLLPGFQLQCQVTTALHDTLGHSAFQGLNTKSAPSTHSLPRVRLLTCQLEILFSIIFCIASLEKTFR